MLYQVFFPFAIISRLKLPWLAVGVVFHLSIAFFMGLITFSLAMIGLELFLVTDDEYNRASARLRKVAVTVDAWRRAGRGQIPSPERVLAFRPSPNTTTQEAENPDNSTILGR